MEIQKTRDQISTIYQSLMNNDGINQLDDSSTHATDLNDKSNQSEDDW